MGLCALPGPAPPGPQSAPPCAELGALCLRFSSRSQLRHTRRDRHAQRHGYRHAPLGCSGDLGKPSTTSLTHQPGWTGALRPLLGRPTAGRSPRVSPPVGPSLPMKAPRAEGAQRHPGTASALSARPPARGPRECTLLTVDTRAEACTHSHTCVHSGEEVKSPSRCHGNPTPSCGKSFNWKCLFS